MPSIKAFMSYSRTHGAHRPENIRITVNLSKNIIKEIQKISGEENVKISEADRYCYSYDATGRIFMPDAVVFPGSAGEISSILTLATKNRFNVIPRGSGSGTTGGSVAVQGGVVMVLTRMNNIMNIDTDNLVAVAETGVITADFHREVESKGLFYPPDPSSSAFSTLGGNLAECAGGPRAVKYGVTRDYVLGLKAVLPTGEIIKTGVQTAKGVVGYDLTKLIVGSEGTLAVITEMTLKLLPLPRYKKTMTAIFPKMHDAASAVSEIIRRGLVPSAVEYLDNAAIRCAEGYLKSGLPVDAGALLIIESDGRTDSEAGTAIFELETACKDCGASETKIAKTKEETENIWKARKALSPAVYQIAPDKINEDIVVPRSKIPMMTEFLEKLSKDSGLAIVAFGHAGDGNIHVNVMLDKKDKIALAKAHKAVDDIFDYTLELGGTISGEHGIGITKSEYMTKEIGPVEIKLMRDIKKAFDPAGILNPGKIF